MAETEAALPSAEISLARRVQELVLNREEPSHLYISRKEELAQDEVPSEIPVIDLSKVSPSGSDPSYDRQELHNLRSALSVWGCFQAVVHGKPTCRLDEVSQVAREFFHLHMEEKKKITKGVEEMEGYGADPIPAKDYMTKMRMTTEAVYKAMARSLNLEGDCFLNLFCEGALLQARFNYCSPFPRPDLILGLKPHTDGTSLTVIRQDTEGLQIMHDNRWITVPSMPDALLVLMGDQMECTGVLTHSDRDRISVPAFYSPEPNKEIGPADGLINEAGPKAYKNMRGYADIHWGYYQQGLRAIHVTKV